MPHAMTSRRFLVLLCGFVAACIGAPLGAQSVDVIRGRVTGPDNQPVEGAQVTVTTLAGNVSRVGRTDLNGRYTVTFPGGDGDYFVTFASIGFSPRRFEIKRVADEDILIADAKLTRTATSLDAVRVEAPRNRPTRNDNSADIGGSERRVDQSGIPAGQLGDLASMAASMPGVLLVPGADGDPSGFSVLGLGSDQNTNTLNGQNFSGSDLPRDAATSASLATSPYDVSRGGFSGGNFNLRTRSGTNFIQRTASLVLDAPTLQWTDQAARSLGQEYSNVSLGGGFSGPVKYNQAFYNVSFQAGRRANDLHSLLNTDVVGLQTAGIARDSVTRLLGILSGLNIPTIGRASSNERLSDQASLLAAFDLAPSGARNGAAYNLTMNGSWNRQSPVSNLTTELPAHSGNRTDWNYGAQARHSTYFEWGALTETTLGLTASQTSTSPFLDAPSGSVRVNSTFADGSNGVKFVSFGGSPQLSTNSKTSSIAFTNQLSWFSSNNKHRVKLTTELRRDGYLLDQRANQYGSLAFNTLGDLQAGTPAVFSRQLQPRSRSGSQIVGAVALGDSWRMTRDLQVQFGVRVDGNQFDVGPAENPGFGALFGTANTSVPNRYYVSPRIGFSWTYGQAAQIGGFEGAFRGPRAVVRGGVGVFQGLPGTQLLGSAIDNTGLPTGLQQVTCVGAAVPVPDWSGWMTNPSTIPNSCAGGSPGFASTVPNVALLSNDFVAPRSVRANLQWNGPILGNRFSATFDVTYSSNLNQTGTVDLNLATVPLFLLNAEGARPVFVAPSSIDPATGSIAAGASRLSSLYNRVTQQRSDLRSESQQYRMSVAPATFNSTYSWSLSYVYSAFRDRQRGFGASTGGNPYEVEWGRSNFDSHHQIQYSIFYNFFDFVRVSWNGSFRSGTPFTPLVSGDVNGDGYNNDRAFVFNPATTADPALAASMQSLLATAPSYVRDCLTGQLGAVARRNSCEGPWTSQANLSISFNPIKLRLPQRASFSLSVSNPLGALDMLAHGENNVSGWGQTAFPDQSLLYVRGFNVATQRYKYDVNQRFGSSNPLFQQFRTPVTVTAMFRFDIGPTREQQSLTQQLNLGRRNDGNKLNEGILRAIYANGGLVNPLATILRQSDTLQLTAVQADSLATMNRWYLVRLDSVWSPVHKFLAALPNDYDEGEAYARYKSARESSVDLLRRLAPVVRRLLTDEQRRKLPALVASYMDLRYLAAIRSGTAGSTGNSFGAGDGIALPAGGGGGGQQVIIVR